MFDQIFGAYLFIFSLVNLFWLPCKKCVFTVSSSLFFGRLVKIIIIIRATICTVCSCNYWAYSVHICIHCLCVNWNLVVVTWGMVDRNLFIVYWRSHSSFFTANSLPNNIYNRICDQYLRDVVAGNRPNEKFQSHLFVSLSLITGGGAVAIPSYIINYNCFLFSPFPFDWWSLETKHREKQNTWPKYATQVASTTR